jgi:hypothetical protein
VRTWVVRAPGRRSVAERRAHAGDKGRGAVTAVLAGEAPPAQWGLLSAFQSFRGMLGARWRRSEEVPASARAAPDVGAPHRRRTERPRRRPGRAHRRRRRAGGAATAGAVATAGADGRLCALEPRASLAMRGAPLALPDFPYCAAAAGGLAFCGCGDGSVVVSDLAAPAGGGELYRLRAGAAAVRAVEVGAGCLVAAGDDGEVVCFAFETGDG